ncbi:MAG TPA: trypsin-like peptidase domain-containing protein [Chlamydiales bacterium]|nr:trypsin-like peptidase domain-containing protein [Chlamydiales bacterium]
MDLMPISSFSDELTTIEAQEVQSLPHKLLHELQEKIRILGEMIQEVQSKQVVDLTALAKRVMPTVVLIESQGGHCTINGLYIEGFGSGCVISEDGYIVTNSHVIEGARKINVVFCHRGLNFPATLVGSDPETDIALLKIESEEALAFSKFGNSDLVEVGSPSVLIGNPLAFQNLLTTGIIGGKSSTLASAGKGHSYVPWDHGIYSDYLFSDTLSNPGNSGGPLFNLEGDVIGLVARGARGPCGGIAMSITSNTAQRIVSELKEKGFVTRSSLGAEIVSLQSPLVPYLSTLVLPESMALWEENPMDGLFVADMLKDSPAMNAGLRKGDFIVAYNDIQVTTQEQFFAYLAMKTVPFSELKLSILRDGDIVDVMVHLGQREVNKVVPIPRLGICVENLVGEKYFTFELDSHLEGVFVNSVEQGSDAIFMGLRPADVITSVIMDGQPEIPVKNVTELEQIIDQTDGDHQCVLVVRSHDRSRPIYVHIDLC